MTWADAALLNRVLLSDTSSWVAAKTEGWQYPVSSEWLILRDLRNWYEAVNAEEGKTSPWPAPWEKPYVSYTEDEAEAIVNAIEATLRSHYAQGEQPQ